MVQLVQASRKDTVTQIITVYIHGEQKAFQHDQNIKS